MTSYTKGSFTRQQRQLRGLGILFGLASCQPTAYCYKQDENGLALLHSLQESSPPPSSLPLAEPEIFSLPLERHVHGPAADSLLYFVTNKLSEPSRDPYQPPPQDPQKTATLGPFLLSTTSIAPYSQRRTLQLQFLSLPALTLPSHYFSSFSDDFSPYSFQTPAFSPEHQDSFWYVDVGRDDPTKEYSAPLGKLGKVLKRYLLEDNNHPVAQTYRNAMKGLARISDGPTQWLFGDQASSSIDLRLGAQRAGLYYKVNFSPLDRLVIGYEQGVFGKDDEPSAIMFQFSHILGPRRR